MSKVRSGPKKLQGGYTSYGSIAQLHKVSTTFEILEKEISKNVAKFVKHLEMDINPRELKNDLVLGEYYAGKRDSHHAPSPPVGCQRNLLCSNT